MAKKKASPREKGAKTPNGSQGPKAKGEKAKSAAPGRKPTKRRPRTSRAKGKTASKKGRNGRRGPKTVAEQEEIVADISIMLARRWRKGHIKKAVAAKYNLHCRAFENYFSRAKFEHQEMIGAATEKTNAQLVQESYGTYLSIIANPESKPSEIKEAQKQIDRLLGLQKPVRIAQTNTEGEDIEPEDSFERFAALMTKLGAVDLDDLEGSEEEDDPESEDEDVEPESDA